SVGRPTAQRRPRIGRARCAGESRSHRAARRSGERGTAVVTALPAQRSTGVPQQRRVRRGAAYSGEVGSNLPEGSRRLEVFAEEGDFNEWEIRQGVRRSEERRVGKECRKR